MWKRRFKSAAFWTFVLAVSSFFCCVLLTLVDRVLESPKWLDPFGWLAVCTFLASFSATVVLLALRFFMVCQVIRRWKRRHLKLAKCLSET